jgi:hypothetical protein
MRTTMSRRHGNRHEPEPHPSKWFVFEGGGWGWEISHSPLCFVNEALAARQ